MKLAELLSRTTLDPATGCMNWNSAKPLAYGQIWISHTLKYQAHRLSYMLANPDVDVSDLLICHHCDNKRCINPEHLYAGTHRDNTMDAVRRNRHARMAPRGEAAPKAKLKEVDIPIIRERISFGESCVKIAKSYGVSHTVIYHIKQRKSWRHV